MKITILEARAFAFNTLREKLVKTPTLQMVFSLDDYENDRIIAAMAKELPRSTCILRLIQFGLADNYEESRRMVEKAVGVNYISLEEYK